MIVLPVECAVFTSVPPRGVSPHGWWSSHPRLVLHLCQDLVDRDSELSEGSCFRASFLGSRFALVPGFGLELVALLARLPCWVINLLAGFLRRNTVIVPKYVALCRREDICQGLAWSYGQLTV
ncbi:hypothetical protein ACE6H2_020745 [Prunus campanulata]